MKKVLIVVIFLFSLSLVNADNITMGLDWLEDNVNWDTASIEDVSFTLLALDANNRNTNVGLIKLNQRKDNNGCFPIGSCNSKDTALATLALYNLGENITSQLTWLNSTLTAAPLPSGEWIIQVITSNTGNCTFSYDNTNSTFQINGVENSWIYINGQNPSISVNFNEPVEYINVDCNLAGNTIVSLLRKIGNTFYIVNQYSGNDVTVEINNACYSSSIGSSCNVDSSYYISWVLNRINIDVKTIPYLENNINNNNLYYAILSDIDDSQINLDNLIENQNIYWNNVYTTSFAVDALEGTIYSNNKTTALNWLMSQQISSGSGTGSWNSNVKDTAAVLYLAFLEEGAYTPPGIGGGYCGDAVKDLDEECDPGGTAGPADDSACVGLCTMNCECPEEPSVCSSNLDCNPNEYCDSVSKTCKQKVYCNSNVDCSSEEYCDTTDGICKSNVECSSNADCDINEECDIINKICKPKSDRCGNNICESQYGEDEFICPQDCVEESVCGNGICEGDEDEENCPDDCKERKSLWWLWLIIIIIILAILGIFGFKYFSKPKAPKGPSFLGPQRPIPPSYPQRPMPGQPVSRKDEALERELDKSLKEAKELLKKK